MAACRVRIVALVTAAGTDGISTEDLRGSLVLHWRKPDVDNALREAVAASEIVRGERDGSGGWRYRSPEAVRTLAETRAARTRALLDVATATRKAAA